ncbi:MAG: cbb3-type cytochrome oxidase assembly protein CcoS [Sedimenticola sp.]|nr:cbb3-type cytochrome oxidase assembly protein CcoS [Sedimenticola sp.]
MDVIYGLIPGMLILGLVGVVVFFWAARTGQFDDLEGEANRILMDDEFTDTEKDAGKGEESTNGQKSSEQEKSSS